MNLFARGVLKQFPDFCLRATHCVLLFFALSLATASASDPENVFTKLGTYTLTPNTELRLSLDDHKEVTYAVTTSDSHSKITHKSSTQNHSGKPFIFFWDTDSQHLWWATRDRLSFTDFRQPSSTHSAVYDRSGGFQLTTLPATFREVVQKTFP